MTEAFCKEVRAVAGFDHPNIVHMLAICATGTHKCMIFECMDCGSLDKLLRKSDPENPTVDPTERETGALIASSDFLHCSLQVARGVAYLASRKYVHHDIASRNCLVDGNLTVKIGDFGLSRELSAMDYYRVGGTQAYLPVRWMPPEALLFGKFTTQSDVWSFGVVMWEVYTFGHQPYTGLSNHEVIDSVKASRVLECPKLCPASVYDVMKVCWTRSPVKRPNMDVIVARLERLLQPGGEGQRSSMEDASGGVCYVNMEYWAGVEEEECARVEQEVLSKKTEVTSAQLESDGVASRADEPLTSTKQANLTTSMCTAENNSTSRDGVLRGADGVDENSVVEANIHARKDCEDYLKTTTGSDEDKY